MPGERVRSHVLPILSPSWSESKVTPTRDSDRVIGRETEELEGLTCGFLVGAGGFEPPTSSVSGKRSPPELSAPTTHSRGNLARSPGDSELQPAVLAQEQVGLHVQAMAPAPVAATARTGHGAVDRIGRLAGLVPRGGPLCGPGELDRQQHQAPLAAQEAVRIPRCPSPRP